MLFRVLDEITDMKRSSGMVQRQRLIYGTIALGLRNGFGMHRKVIGSQEGVPEASGVCWA
jgi:hypothetical protein